MTPLTNLWYHVLLVLWDEPRHGYGIIKEIERRTAGDLVPETGTLYTAIRRLQDEGLLEPLEAPDSGRRGSCYRLSRRGRAALKAETRRLHELVALARELKIYVPGPAGAGRR